MLQRRHLENLLIIDVETASISENFNELDEDYQQLWKHKAQFFREGYELEESYAQKAALYAEFSKIICISVAFFRMTDPDERRFELRVKSFYGDDEYELLNDFKTLLNGHFSHRKYAFSGHNIKDFDIPFLYRRMLINQIYFPYKLNNDSDKPWTLPIVDTFQLWKFGEMKNYTSLRLLMKVLNVEFPQLVLQGNEINDTYWKQGNIEKIKEHCQNDVTAVAQLLLRYKGFDLLKPEDVVISDVQEEIAQDIGGGEEE